MHVRKLRRRLRHGQPQRRGVAIIRSRIGTYGRGDVAILEGAETAHGLPTPRAARAPERHGNVADVA